MCGLLGVIGNLPQPALLHGALRGLRHRGPDSSGRQSVVGSDTQIWLGHTRLSILDLSEAGHQPMRSRNGKWWVVFNGEIYNHNDLRRELEAAWRGHSDTETLVEALAAWGLIPTLERLNGMFAFAAIDVAEGKGYLCRDPFGIKPLYYSLSSRTVSFASEIGPLLQVSERWHEIDPDALQTYLSLRFVPSPHTLLDGILRVPPGHVVAIDVKSRDARLERYIRPTMSRFGGSIEDAVSEYGRLIKQAVDRQMLSDVPVGIFLSGGVDSAFVAAMAAQRAPETPCFSVGFGSHAPECELRDAARSAAALGLRCHEVLVTHDDLWSVFEPCVASIEEPLGTTSMLPMWHLARRARERVTVVLTGQGSDEPWGGYLRYRAELWRNPAAVRWMAKCAFPVLNKVPNVPDQVLRALDAMQVGDTAQRFEREYCLMTDAQRKALTGRSDYGRAVESILYWLAWSGRRSNDDGAGSMMTIDSRMGLADDLLLYGDKISMAHSLEARVPMLDIELIRFVESLPLHYRLTLRQGKIVHKLAAEKHLPSEIVHRRKKAFQMPFGVWIRTVWRARAAAVLFKADASHLAWVRAAEIRRLWDEHQRGTRDRSRQLFALLAFAFWCRNRHAQVQGEWHVSRQRSSAGAA